jgi:drug/metabolite transporter (DMT)-like permease
LPAKPARDLFAVLSLLIGASLWGVIWYPMRLLEGGGLAGIWLTLLIYAAALAASLPWTWSSLAEFRRSPALLAGLMLAAGWTNIAFVEAVLAGNILRVLLLFYLAPLWQTLMGWVFLHERPSQAALASLLVAMSGALTMLWDAEIGLPWPGGAADWYALSSGFAFAASNVITRKGQGITIRAKALAVWSGVVLLAGAIILLLRVPVPEIDIGIFSGAVALGVFGILLMTLLVQYGVTHMPVHRSAVLALIELVAGAISQQLLTDETVTAREWLGGALIIAGAYLSARAVTPAGR